MALLGGAALSIDVGSLDGAKQRLLGVAEAAAIAGARDLPGSPATAKTDAGNVVTTNLAGTNFTGVTVTYQTPFNGDSSQIEVTVKANSPSFFANVFGIFSTAVSAKAAAKNSPVAGTPAALFANNSTCGANNGIVVSGNSAHITGGAISNGSVNIGGNPQTHVDSVVYGGPNNCALVGGSKADTVKKDSSLKPWPKTFDRNAICGQPGAHNSSSAVTISGDATGIYCSTVSISQSDNNKTLNVTLIAPTITITGQHLTLTAFTQGLLIYQTQGNFDFSPQNSTITGFIWIENGNLTLSGNSAIGGFFEAQNITVSGNSFQMTGTGPTVGGQAIAITPTE